MKHQLSQLALHDQLLVKENEEDVTWRCHEKAFIKSQTVLACFPWASSSPPSSCVGTLMITYVLNSHPGTVRPPRMGIYL